MVLIFGLTAQGTDSLVAVFRYALILFYKGKGYSVLTFAACQRQLSADAFNLIFCIPDIFILEIDGYRFSFFTIGKSILRIWKDQSTVTFSSKPIRSDGIIFPQSLQIIAAEQVKSQCLAASVS